jgi:hypothetical protein
MVLEHRTIGVVVLRDHITIEECLLVVGIQHNMVILRRHRNIIQDITINVARDLMSMDSLLHSRWEEDHILLLLGNATIPRIRNRCEDQDQDNINTLHSLIPLNRSVRINPIHGILLPTDLDMVDFHHLILHQGQDSILLLVVLINIMHEIIQGRILHQTIIVEQLITHLVEAYQRRLIGSKRRNWRRWPNHLIQTKKEKSRRLVVVVKMMNIGEMHRWLQMTIRGNN